MRWQWAPAIAAAAWISAVTGILVLNEVGLGPGTVCTFKRVTGIPCPTCGGTRAAVCLATARPLDALWFNPLVTVGLVLLAGWAVLRFGFGRRIAWRVGRRTRIIGWSLIAVAAAANWVYLIFTLP